MALIFAVTAAVFVLLYLGPYRNPGWIHSPGFAASLLLLGMAAFSTSEFIREAVRKPYIVYNVVLGNQITTDEVARSAADRLSRRRRLDEGLCAKALSRDARRRPHRPATIAPCLPAKDRVALGAVIFQYHCNDCHAIEGGLFGRRRRWCTVGRPRCSGRWSATLDRVHFAMPPWSGTPEEAELVAAYLQSIATPRPGRNASPHRGDQVMDPTTLIDTATPGLPAPVWFIELFKVLGLTLHMVPMNLWYAGVILAMLALRVRQRARPAVLRPADGANAGHRGHGHQLRHRAAAVHSSRLRARFSIRPRC